MLYVPFRHPWCTRRYPWYPSASMAKERWRKNYSKILLFAVNTNSQSVMKVFDKFIIVRNYHVDWLGIKISFFSPPCLNWKGGQSVDRLDRPLDGHVGAAGRRRRARHPRGRRRWTRPARPSHWRRRRWRSQWGRRRRRRGRRRGGRRGSRRLMIGWWRRATG